MTKKLEAKAVALKELEEEVIAKSTPNANGARDFEVEGLRKEAEVHVQLKNLLGTQLREEQQRYLKNLQDYQKRIDDIFAENLVLQAELMKLRENATLTEARLR